MTLMCRQSIFIISFILVLGLAGSSLAELVMYWPLDEGSGTTAVDVTGNGNEGTINGTASWVPGQNNLALDFDGSSTYIAVDHEIVRGTWSLAMWIRPRDIPYTDGYYAVWHGDGWAGGVIHLHLRSSTSLLNADFNTGPDVTSTTVLQEDEWYHAVVTVTDEGTGGSTMYINGVLEDETSGGSGGDYMGPGMFGNWSGGARFYHGLMDDIRIYDHVLSETEVLSAMEGKVWPYASSPTPEDGAIYPNTWVSLSWKQGGLAASHDVYMGDNFDDVNEATRDSEVFRVNQGLDTLFYIVGFPGYPFPEGLVNGTTYYWRIDEVNDADPNSPWKGNVWSFTVPPKTAYNPVPANNAKFIDTENISLSWTAGFGSKLHFVYFDDDYDTVANATGAPPTAFTTYNPGPLDLEKTYYWRVDESDGANTYTGDVWSFTTAKEGGGVRGDYYRGMNFENHVLTRTDPQIDFNWGDPGGPDPAVGNDQFSARWTGEVEAAFTETYTFYATGDDGVRLWVDGQQLVNGWIDQGATEYSGVIDLVAGQTYSLVMEYYENGGGTTAELRWSSASTPKQIIPQAALSPPIKASSPSPNNGATGTKLTPILRWGEGDYAASHEVYFGTDADAVANADKSSPEYKGAKALGDESFDPGKLAWFTQYFWRIDEVNATNPDSPWIGNLWNFTTGDFIVIDDFEDYNADENQIWYSWHDGLGYGAPGTPDYFAGNGTGAAIGDETTTSYTEETIVHSGSQAMPLAYDNNKQGFAKYSETELTLTAPRDWTDENVAELSIWFRGYPASTGSFVEGPTGTFTMTASGADIWAVNGVEADEFHFAYKMLTGAGSIVAKVNSVQNTNAWAKAGVMIRETLNPDSAHAMMVVTPASGISFQRRPGTGQTSLDTTTAGIVAPYWVKIDRDLAGNFTASSSTNGTTWTMQGTPENIPMVSNIYIGLAVTSHDTALTCEAVFSNVTTTGNVTGQWTDQDIGIESNDAEPLYVAVSNATGTPAVVIHDDPAASTIGTWTEWVIPLQTFADQGIDLTNVDRIAIGLGTKGNSTTPGGSGKMFFDDIRLYRQREAAGE
jgi:hypothetical protein